MRLGHVRILALVVTGVVAALMLSVSLPPASSQAVDEMSIDSDFEELGFSGVSGSGKINWKLSGQPTQDLRRTIIAKYDTNINLPPSVTRGNSNGNLDSDEIENYKYALDSYLMNMPYYSGTCDDCHGNGPVVYFGCEITAAQLYHKDPGSSLGQAIQVDMKGLLNTNNDTTDDIAIFYKVEVRTDPVKLDIPMDSDALANALYAPFNQTYNGHISLTHLQVLVGFQDYQELRMPKGSMFLLRTPAGEAIWYKTSFDTGSKNSEHIVFSPGDYFENPQVLFVLMILVGHYTTALPHMIYYKFRSKLPKTKHSFAQRVKWIHYLAIVFVILQIVFYFIAVIGPFFFGGLIYWIFSFGLLACVSGLAYQRYFKKEMPKILAMPITGRTAIIPTADGAKLVVTPPAEDKAETICLYCGSLIRAPSAAPTESVLCKECNMPQVMFNTGYSYLILEDDSKMTYKILSRLLTSREHTLFTSASFPEKIMKEHGFKVETAIWITDSGTGHNAINPLRLEFEITRDITKFVKNYPGAVILIDGVNYLIMTNGFDKVFRFLKKLIDIASTNNAMLIVVISKKTLSEEHMDTLCREVDKCIDTGLLVRAEIIQRGKPSYAQPAQREPRPMPESTGGVISPTDRIVIPGPSKSAPSPQRTVAPPPRPQPSQTPQPRTIPPSQPPRSPPAPVPQSRPVATPPPQPPRSQPSPQAQPSSAPRPVSLPPKPQVQPAPAQQPRPAAPPQAPRPQPTPQPPRPQIQPPLAPPPKAVPTPPTAKVSPAPPRPAPKVQQQAQPKPAPPVVSSRSSSQTTIKPQPAAQPSPTPIFEPHRQQETYPKSQARQTPPQEEQGFPEERTAAPPFQEEKPKPDIAYKSTAIFITESSPIFQEEETQPEKREPAPDEQVTTPEEKPPQDDMDTEEPPVEPAPETLQEPIEVPKPAVQTPQEERKERLKAILDKKKEQKQVSKVILSTASADVSCASCMDKIQVDDWMIICACGAKYHTKCASGSPTCQKCNASLSPS